MGGSAGWTAYLPLLVMAGVMALRFRNLQKAQALRLPLLWIFPLIVTAAVCLALAAMPPSLSGWLALGAGVAIGGAIGVQRARAMRLHVEGAGRDACVMVRQSPLALMLVLGLFVGRRLLVPGGMDIAATHPSAQALLVTDAMLGVVLGMVVLSRLVLWRRARDLVVGLEPGA